MLFIKELPFILSQYLLSFHMFSIFSSLKKELRNDGRKITVDSYIQMTVYFLYSADAFPNSMLEKMRVSRVLVKLLVLMLLFTGKGLTEIQPQTPCFSFTSTSPQLLKFNSVCYLRRGLGKRTHHEKKKNGPSKEQKKNNPPPNTSLQDRVKNVSSGLLF